MTMDDNDLIVFSLECLRFQSPFYYFEQCLKLKLVDVNLTVSPLEQLLF